MGGIVAKYVIKENTKSDLDLDLVFVNLVLHTVTRTTFIFYVFLNSNFRFGLDFGVSFYFLGPTLFMGSGYISKNVLGSTHVVEQLLNSIIPSILTFDFELILFFFIFLDPNGLFLGSW